MSIPLESNAGASPISPQPAAIDNQVKSSGDSKELAQWKRNIEFTMKSMQERTPNRSISKVGIAGSEILKKAAIGAVIGAFPIAAAIAKVTKDIAEPTSGQGVIILGFFVVLALAVDVGTWVLFAPVKAIITGVCAAMGSMAGVKSGMDEIEKETSIEKQKENSRLTSVDTFKMLNGLAVRFRDNLTVISNDLKEPEDIIAIKKFVKDLIRSQIEAVLDKDLDLSDLDKDHLLRLFDNKPEPQDVLKYNTNHYLELAPLIENMAAIVNPE